MTAKRFAPLIVIAVALAAFFATGLNHYLSLEAVRENRAALVVFVDRWEFLAALAYGAAYAVLIALSVPVGAVATITAGFLFGIVYGTLVTVVGASVGAIAIFLIAKTSIGDEMVKRAGPPRLRRGRLRDVFPPCRRCSPRSRRPW